MPGNIIPLKGQKQLVEAANVLAKRGLDFDINFVGNGDSNYIAELNVYIEQHELAGFISFHDRSFRGVWVRQQSLSANRDLCTEPTDLYILRNRNSS